MTLGERFWSKVDKVVESPCWLWTSALGRGGYPLFWMGENRRAARAHRLAYEDMVGPIPAGLTLDHLCRVRHCVNPAHLEPCTAGENAKRSPNAPYNVWGRATHCRRGHEFTAATTAIHHGRRECRACAALLARQRRTGRRRPDRDQHLRAG